MAKKLRRFKWTNLPVLPRQQVRLVNGLLWRLPQTVFEDGFAERFREQLEPMLNARLEVTFDGLRALSQGEMQKLLGEPCCAAVIGLPPREEKALLEVDLAMAQLAIDKLLGGGGEDGDLQRGLSEIEEGVFSFVLLKVLGQFQSEAADDGASALKLEGLYGSYATLKERFAVDAGYLVAAFKLRLAGRKGYARLFLPESMVSEVFAPAPPTEGPALERVVRRVLQRLDLVRTFKASLTIEVGRISFSMSDLEALEVEDIILVEETEVRLEGGSEDDSGALNGRVVCRVGAGAHNTIQAALTVSDSGRYQIEIEGISPVGEPSTRAHLFREDAAGAEGEEEMASENAARTSKPGVTSDDDALAHRLRAAAAARARAGDPGLLGAGRVGSDAEDGAEHSDDPDDEDVDGTGEVQGGSAEGVGLLDDVTVAMSVELGRVTVSAADVVSLRAGQVIELSRAPGEPVDLMVDGKRIGKGELVEIDGELGVRILSLAR
jgi:type III secretion system YscQ/HrcQ family protein